MNIEELKEKRNSMKDATEFMNQEELQQAQELFEGFYVVKDRSFYQIADKAITLQELRTLSAHKVQKIFNIICTANTLRRIERFKFEGDSIYQFRGVCYVWLRHGNKTDYGHLIKKHGKYVD